MLPKYQGLENRKNALAIVYKNHRGETSERLIIPGRFWFGQTLWHPRDQWFLDAYDLDRREDRSFALSDIILWEQEEEDVPVRRIATRQAAGT